MRTPESPGPPGGGIAGVFDRAAETYDAVGVPWFGPIAAGLVEALEPQLGDRALDVGCGKGAVLLRLAEEVGPGGHVVGVDLAPRMVALARAAAAAQLLANVEVHVSDAMAPVVEETGFDLIASSLVLFFLPDPAAALTAWRRLLRPEGRLGVATFGRNDHGWDAVDTVFTPYLPQRMLDARTSGQRGPFGSDAGMEALLSGAGFEDVRTVSATVEAVLRDPDHWYEFSWSHGQRAMWEAVPEALREQVRRRACSALEDVRRPDGTISFTQQVRYTLGSRPLSRD